MQQSIAQTCPALQKPPDHRGSDGHSQTAGFHSRTAACTLHHQALLESCAECRLPQSVCPLFQQTCGWFGGGFSILQPAFRRPFPLSCEPLTADSYMSLCPETGFVLQMASVEMASEEMPHQRLPHEVPPLGTQRLAGVLVVVCGGCCSPAPCAVRSS